MLLYKLMYTEYPIFPDAKVHIPTTPAYPSRLKSTVRIFLDERGTLQDIEDRIEVSEEVAKQVKINKEKLIVLKKQKQQKTKKKKKQVHVYDYDQEEVAKEENVSVNSAKTQHEDHDDQE